MTLAAVMLRDHGWPLSKSFALPHHELVATHAALEVLAELRKEELEKEV
ncbi:MAG: hypothetical protein MJ014_00110 [Methanocorpusculum sp.]|nr:hypothetical protein [Methanocorpusculum sp.]